MVILVVILLVILLVMRLKGLLKGSRSCVCELEAWSGSLHVALGARPPAGFGGATVNGVPEALRSDEFPATGCLFSFCDLDGNFGPGLDSEATPFPFVFELWLGGRPGLLFFPA